MGLQSSIECSLRIPDSSCCCLSSGILNILMESPQFNLVLFIGSSEFPDTLVSLLNGVPQRPNLLLQPINRTNIRRQLDDLVLQLCILSIDCINILGESIGFLLLIGISFGLDFSDGVILLSSAGCTTQVSLLSDGVGTLFSGGLEGALVVESFDGWLESCWVG